jgi:uncharacterized protein (DUF952 family)
MEQIYHLAPAARWYAWPNDQPYLPAEYDADGFIHCTAGDALMIAVANRFYRATAGEYVLLMIDPSRLTAPLKWEPSSDDLAALFPHIYGPINRAAVLEVRAVRRAANGEFLGW